MIENKKRFKISGSMVEDTMDIIPSTLWQDEKQKQKYCDELNNLHIENKNKQALLNDELRGLFKGYIIQCRSISEEAIITMIKRDVKKIVFEVFEE